MGIVTKWAIRLQTSDFYGPSPLTPPPPTPTPFLPSPPPCQTWPPPPMSPPISNLSIVNTPLRCRSGLWSRP